jgi:hypothetical protein
MPEAASVGEALAGAPGSHHHFKGFLETGFRLFWRDLKPLELAMAITLAHAKIEAPAREEV